VTRREALAAVLLLASLLGGCAKPGFPPGGPVDTTPPRVLLTAPADSTTRVPPGTEIEILFSEAMDRVSVRDGFRIYPPPSGPSFHWSGRRLRVSWEEPLRPATTYQAFLSAGARDAHGVTLGVPITIRFTTGDSLDPGKIRGVVQARTLPTKGVPVWAYPDSLGPRPDFSNVSPSYATETDTSAAYALTGLPLGRGFTVHAAYDLNRSGAIDSATDIVASYPSVIRLTPQRPVADSINIVAVDPHAPSIVSGSVFSPDSTSRYRVEAKSDSDTTFVRFVERKGPGDYLLRVPAGAYRLRAYRVAPSPGPPTAEVRREELLIARAEETYEHVDFHFGPDVTPPKR
jgi:Big-like domain-containing protein